ncbi:MAG: transcription elongation factor GreAB [Amphritea sp.]
MDKQQLIAQIMAKLQEDLEVNIEAANEARDAAIHDESVPETQYDTIGLEASYLAHGQSKRVQELEMNLADYRSLVVRDFSADTPAGLSALVTLQDEFGEERHIFIGPAGGGIQLDLDGYTVIVVTPEAPLGKALIGKYVGDMLSLPQGESEITHLS